MPLLIVEKGPEKGRTLELTEGCRIVFGRDDTCDFVTGDHACSRRHFGVGEKRGQYFVQDLNSTHGTQVNGFLLDRASALHDGDTISVGETVITFSLETGRGLVGKTIAGYQITDRLGRGGMGTVYRAKQVALDRDVALKVLSGRLSNDKTFINRFFKEAQAAARLNHPNVVQVYDVREEKGLYLISLEMMDRGTVQDLATAEGQLKISRVLDIARDAARGLVYAEKKGIVHGDIKPDNLMVNSDGHIKISDLGLARDAGEMAGQGEEGIFGTPHFVAPEQAQGKPVDSRSDIYSLGATLYRLLAGETPFAGQDVREIILKQINEDPRDLRELRPDCPQDLSDLVAVMMAKDPAERFETASRLLEALEALGTTGRLHKAGSGGKKALVPAIILIVVVLAAGGYVGSRIFGVNGAGEDDGRQPAEVGPGGGNGDERDRTLERQALELEVERLVVEANKEEIRLNREGKGEDLDALGRLAKQYLAAMEAGPNTKAAADALSAMRRVQDRIKRIKTERERAAAEREQRRAAADAAFEKARSAVEEATKKDHFAVALAEVIAAREPLADTHRAGERRDLEQTVRRGASERAQAINADVTAKLEANDFDGARAALRPMIDAFGTGLGETPELALVRDLVAAAKKRLGEIDRLEVARREAQRKLDARVAFEALQTQYATVGRGMDLEARLAELDRACSSIQTPEPKAKLEAARARLQRMIELRDELVKSIEQLDITLPTSAKPLPAGKVVGADAGGITVRRRRGSDAETVKWADITFEDAHRYLLRRFVTTPRQTLDLAIGCLECGLVDEARELVSDWRESPPAELAEELPAFLADLDREAEAVRRVAAAKALYAQAKGGRDDAWFQLKDELDRLFDSFRDTRAFVLHSDGSTP